VPKNHSRFVRRARIAVAFMAITATFSALAATQVASARTPHAAKTAYAAEKAQATKKAHDSGSLPAEGIFSGCDPDTDMATCLHDLAVMHSAGLQVVVQSIWGQTPTDVSTFAADAQSIGMSVMWEINDPGFWGGEWTGSSASNDFPTWAAACGCTDTAQILTYIVQSLATLPSTYGYYAADDEVISPGEHGGLTQYVNEIKALDPSAMVMIGSAVSQGTTYASTGATLGTEIYPETTGNLMPAGSNLSTWDSVQQSVTQDQRAATEYGTPSAFILQAFTFGDSLTDGEDVGVCTARMSSAQCASLLNYPSASTQLELRNEVLGHAHPKLILWYTFAQSYDQGDRWAGLTAAIKAPYPAAAITARVKHTKRHAKHAQRQTKHGKRHTKHAQRQTKHGKRHTKHAQRHPRHGRRHEKHAKRGTQHATRNQWHGLTA
jgi:hypothetical protein